MSTTYVPRRRKRVIHTPWSYAHGGFDANADGGLRLGELHVALGLPVDPFMEATNRKFPNDRRFDRTPWRATAAETRAWAIVVTHGLKFIEDNDHYLAFFTAWRDFLATCSGYWVQT